MKDKYPLWKQHFISTTHLLDSMKWCLVQQEVRIYAQNHLGQPEDRIVCVSLMLCANCTCNVWCLMLYLFFRSQWHHFKLSVNKISYIGPESCVRNSGGLPFQGLWVRSLDQPLKTLMKTSGKQSGPKTCSVKVSQQVSCEEFLQNLSYVYS